MRQLAHLCMHRANWARRVELKERLVPSTSSSSPSPAAAAAATAAAAASKPSRALAPASASSSHSSSSAAASRAVAASASASASASSSALAASRRFSVPVPGRDGARNSLAGKTVCRRYPTHPRLPPLCTAACRPYAPQVVLSSAPQPAAPTHPHLPPLCTAACRPYAPQVVLSYAPQPAAPVHRRSCFPMHRSLPPLCTAGCALGYLPRVGGGKGLSLGKEKVTAMVEAFGGFVTYV